MAHPARQRDLSPKTLPSGGPKKGLGSISPKTLPSGGPKKGLGSRQPCINIQIGPPYGGRPIHRLREEAYQSFLVDEAKFNFEVIREIGRSYETPARILDALFNDVRARLDTEEIGAVLRDSCSKYASLITQFFYILNLSNTQARRSRAGTTFEQVIYKMYETLGYEYVSQEKVGSRAFDAKGLGKIVDSLLPNLESFGKHRSECIIGTMKTTLRERWQVVCPHKVVQFEC